MGKREERAEWHAEYTFTHGVHIVIDANLGAGHINIRHNVPDEHEECVAPIMTVALAHTMLPYIKGRTSLKRRWNAMRISRNVGRHIGKYLCTLVELGHSGGPDGDQLSQDLRGHD